MSHAGELEKTGEGFPQYLREANKQNMDVNDWIEEELGWAASLEILETTVYPYLNKNSIVYELGPGTGRHARHLISKVTKGELHLIDKSPWIVQFLQKYFQENPNTHIYQCNGYSFPLPLERKADLMISFGTFIGLNLGLFYLYASYFFNILKPGGYCILNYLDITTSFGWEHLKSSSLQYGNIFTYHALETVDHLFTSAGFEIVKREQLINTYLIIRKPLSN
jgi:Methyltransferase domain